MPKIAIIQDGTEVARQSYADITGCFERCTVALSRDGVDLAVHTFTDEAVEHLLDHVHPDEYACLVFASNSLLSSQVNRALERRGPALEDYLAAGGGVVILHQLFDTLEPVLPHRLCPVLTDRVSPRGPEPATAYDPEDLLLHYPLAVPMPTLHDGGPPAGPPSFYYKAMSSTGLPESLKPVLTHGSDVLVARSYDHLAERVVVATPPLDWQRSDELLANALRFAALGRPSRLVWSSGNKRTALVRRWLGMDGKASVRPLPPHDAPLDRVDRWLLDNVEMLATPPVDYDAVQRRPEVISFLGRGGALVTTDNAASPVAARISVQVGNHIERSLASRLYAELRATQGWETIQYAFELRNIVSALALLAEDPGNLRAGAVTLPELAALRAPLRERLRIPEHREDLSSSIALAASLFLLADGWLDRADVDWMAEDPRGTRFEVALQIRAVLALADRRPDSGFLTAAREGLTSHAPALASLAPVVRILDSLALLDQSGLLGPGEPTDAEELSTLVCDLLEAHPPKDAAYGWLSVEATADLVRGLVVLLDRLPPDASTLADRLSEDLAVAVAALHRSQHRYERNRRGVAWLSRLTHALVVAERRFPIGLQRLTDLEWPAQHMREPETSGAARALLDHLSAENRTLREETQRGRAEHRAARVGRFTATALGALLITVPFGYVLALLEIGRPWEMITNTALISSAYLVLLYMVLSLLSRWRLLAGPADALRRWIAANVTLTRLLRRPGPERGQSSPV